MSSKTTGDLQRRLQSALADMSSFVCKSDDVENEQMVSESWDYARYLERVHTYKSTMWFAKPMWMSPIVCSRYGWINVDEDVLQCVGCRTVFVGRLPSSYDPVVYDACRKRMENQIRQMAHHPCCMWPGNPTPLSVVERNGSYYESGDATVLALYLKRVSGLMKLGPELPVINPLSMSLNEADLNSLIELSERLNFPNGHSAETRTALSSASVLALCGWEVAGDASSPSCPQIQCKTCNRCNGLWNFTTHSSVSKGNVDSRLSDGIQNEDFLSLPDEEVVSINDYRSSLINLGGNVESGRSGLELNKIVFTSVGGSADRSNKQIIGCHDDTYATEIKLRLLAEELRDSVASHRSEDAAESQMPVSCCTFEQNLEADQLSRDQANSDLSRHLSPGHSFASTILVKANDKLMEAVTSESAGAISKPNILASINSIVDLASQKQEMLDGLTNQSADLMEMDILGDVVHIVQGDTSVEADSVLSCDHLTNQLQTSSETIEMLGENQLTPSCNVPIEQIEAGSAEKHCTELLIVKTLEESVSEDRSMHLKCDLKLEHPLEELHNDDIDITDPGNNMPDLLQPGFKALVPTTSMKELHESTCDGWLDTNDFAVKSSSRTDVELLVSRNDDHAVLEKTSCENSFELVSLERCEEPLLDDASLLTPLSDNDSQTQSISSYPCDIATRTENKSSAHSDSDSTDGQQSSSADHAVNGTDLLRSSNGSFKVSFKSGKRHTSPTSDEHQLPDEKKRRRRFVFDTVAEHRPWCPWVLSAGATDEQSNRPWLRLLRNLLSVAARKPSSIDAGSSPKVLESIRYLFRSWASDVAS